MRFLHKTNLNNIAPCTVNVFYLSSIKITNIVSRMKILSILPVISFPSNKTNKIAYKSSNSYFQYNNLTLCCAETC